ncbi:MAG: AAA family ATPase, partial [Planctomycetota bacterium]
LDETLQHTQTTQHSHTVLIGGESGVGKTALLREWLRSLKVPNYLVLRLRCFRQDSTPLRLLNGLVQELVQVLSLLPPSTWKDSFDEHIDGISASFPQARQLVDKGINPGLKSGPGRTYSIENENRATRDLRKWLIQLNRHFPVLMVIDDAQWADKRSLVWLAELAQHKEFAGTFILVDEGMNASDEDSSENDYVEQIMQSAIQAKVDPHDAESPTAPCKSMQRVTVPALTENQSRQLLTHWREGIDFSISKSILDNIVERSHGSPFLLREFFQTFVHYSKRGSITEELWLAENPASNSLRSRLSLLPKHVESILHYLAIVDHPLRFHQVKTAARIKPKEMQPAINLLESQGWISSRMVDGVQTIEIAHEKFRRAIVSSLPKDRLQRRHFHLAKMLAGSTPPPWSRMAEHYWEANQFREAAACYLQASRKAAQAASYAQALEYLERANHKAATRTAEEIRQVRELEADCLGGAGNSLRSALIYDELRLSATNDDTKLLFECKAGEQLIRAGQLDRAVQHLGSVLEKLNITRLSRDLLSQIGLRSRLLREATKSRKTSNVHENQPLSRLYKTLNRLGVPLTILDDQYGPELIVRMKKLTDSMGSEADRAIALIHLGTLLAGRGGILFKRGISLLLDGRKLAQSSNNVTALALFHFCWLILQVQYGKLKGISRRAVKVQYLMDRESRNMNWEIQFMRWCMTTYYWYGMKFEEGRQFIWQARQSADERSDSMAQFLMRSGNAFLPELMIDDTTTARESLAFQSANIATRRFQTPWFFHWINKIQLGLYQGDIQHVQTQLNQDWKRLTKSIVFQTNYYRFAALNIRLCFQLLKLKSSTNKKNAAEAFATAEKISQLESSAFKWYGKAHPLVINSFLGKIAPASDWLESIDALESLEHRMFANALRWHVQIHFPELATTSSARAAFVEQGCVAPEKLMNIILPLPPRSSDEK